ncbi:MAG: hypothetical protein U1F76_03210 [Candidatus Competibacteraceae bacterium]
MHDLTRPMPEATTAAEAPGEPPKPAFEEPRLTFIEPKLTPRGDLRKVTAGIFGGFSP